MKISNYDEYNYDYSRYWEHRDYENQAERKHLKKALKNAGGNWFIDIGGSYGRNLDLYYSKFKKPIIVDYSLLTLQNSYEKIKKTFPNTTLISANAYYLPFRTSSFDGGLMVRVLHHIENVPQYMKEISRIMTGRALYIQEFANKLHFKAVFKNIFRLNFKFFDQSPYQQPSHGNFEGTKGESTVFYNYHPQYITKRLTENGFAVRGKQGVSFLRVPFLKRLLGENFLVALEGLIQKLFRGVYFAPSIFYKTIKSQDQRSPSSLGKLKDILVCPKCKMDLKFTESEATCIHCDLTFKKENNVWDFRIQ